MFFGKRKRYECLELNVNGEILPPCPIFIRPPNLFRPYWIIELIQYGQIHTILVQGYVKIAMKGVESGLNNDSKISSDDERKGSGASGHDQRLGGDG